MCFPVINCSGVPWGPCIGASLGWSLTAPLGPSIAVCHRKGTRCVLHIPSFGGPQLSGLWVRNDDGIGWCLLRAHHASTEHIDCLGTHRDAGGRKIQDRMEFCMSDTGASGAKVSHPGSSVHTFASQQLLLCSSYAGYFIVLPIGILARPLRFLILLNN